MATYKDLLAQRESLEKKIADARKVEMDSALQKIHQLIADYDLTETDVFPSRRTRGPATKQTNKVAPKYRNKATGETWTGRGKPPAWIRDEKTRDIFLIEQ